MSETKKEKTEQSKAMVSNYIYLVVGFISYPLGKLIFSLFPIDLAITLFLILEATQILGLKLMQIWFAKIDPNLWNKAKDEFEDAKDGVLGDTKEVKLGLTPNATAEISPKTELAEAKFVQKQINETKAVINGKVAELEAKEVKK